MTTSTTTPLEEVFVLPLTRAELDLVEGEISVMYAIELAKQHQPSFLVLTGDGEEPYPEWLARLGGREVAKKLARFIETKGVDGLHQLEGKLSRLQRGVK